MARPICPSCGKPYNGKRCKNCLYECFSEELSHGLHTHAGEPLVVDAPVRKPIAHKDPLVCDRRTKKATALPLILILVAVIAGTSILSAVVQSIHAPVLESANSVVESPEPESLPSDCETVLYAENGITVLTDWKDGQAYTDGFTIALRNDSDRDLTVYARQVIVNDCLMDRSRFNCRVSKGNTGQGTFSLDDEELAYSGIGTVQSLSVSLLAYDSKSLDTVAEIGPLLLKAKAVPEPAQSNSLPGDILYEDAELRMMYRGYLPSSYAPEMLPDGKLLFSLENASEHPMWIYIGDATVNGKEARLSFWCELPANTRTVARMHLFALEDLGISEIGQLTDLSLQFQVENPDAEASRHSIGPFTIPIKDA